MYAEMYMDITKSSYLYSLGNVGWGIEDPIMQYKVKNSPFHKICLISIIMLTSAITGSKFDQNFVGNF